MKEKKFFSWTEIEKKLQEEQELCNQFPLVSKVSALRFYPYFMGDGDAAKLAGMGDLLHSSRLSLACFSLDVQSGTLLCFDVASYRHSTETDPLVQIPFAVTRTAGKEYTREVLTDVALGRRETEKGSIHITVKGLVSGFEYLSLYLKKGWFVIEPAYINRVRPETNKYEYPTLLSRLVPLH